MFDETDDGAADDDAIGFGGDFGGLVWIGDAEADANGDVGSGFDDGDLFGDAGGDAGLGAGDAEARDVVDEAFGAGGDLFDAVWRRGRGDELDVAEVGRGFEFGVLSGFIRREVEDEDAIGTGGGGFVMEAFVAESVDGVEVSEEDEGDLGVLAEFANHVEDALGGSTGAEGTVGGELVDDAVCEGIGEGEAEFDDVGTGFFEGEDDVDGAIEGRVACADVGDEGAFAVSVELLEAGVDAVGSLGGGHGWGIYVLREGIANGG